MNYYFASVAEKRRREEGQVSVSIELKVLDVVSLRSDSVRVPG